MTILERFLGQPPDDHLLANLSDPEKVAISSLEELLDQQIGNPAILISYIEGLDRQEPDIVLSVVKALREVGDARVIEPLRMMAQDVRQEIAAEALQALGTIRLANSARALQTLLPITDPTLRPTAERLLRKLQFSGVAVEPLPLPDPAWRALVSPVDGLGQQSIWFILEERQTAHARFLNVLLNDRAGAVRAAGHRQVPVLMLPPRQSPGHLHDAALPDGSGAMLLMEASFDLGRRLVNDALAWNRQTQIPVAGPLRLLSSWLWSVGADSLPPKRLPENGMGDPSLAATTDRLLEHPAFATWTMRNETILQVAEDLASHPGRDREMWIRRLTGNILAEPVVVEAIGQRLTAMSEWLLLAGDAFQSRLALAAANALADGPPHDQPFIQALVRRDLDLLVKSLGQQ
jgi:hypothetical protein